MKKSYLILALLFFCLLNCNLYAQIIPTPQKMLIKGGELRIDKVIGLMLINDVPEESAITAAEVVNEAFKDFWQVQTTLKTDAKDAVIQLIRITPEQAEKYQIPKNKTKEGYRLHIEKERVTIEGTHPQGIFYGANTLAQIIANGKNKRLACTEIIDWADFEVRGISDDISRGQVQLFPYYKKLIRELARYKQNTLMLYIEDALELHEYSEIGQGRARLTQKEIKEIVGYAEKYFIDIVPIFETLGHQENILNLKGFQKLAEFSGAMSFCVTEPLVYDYLDKVFKELSQLFKSPYLHIGGDESFDVGMGRSRALAQQIGIPALHLQHYKKVADLCRKYGKKPILYGDMLLKYKEILPKIPNDFTIMDWQYRPVKDYKSTASIDSTRLDYWVSPTVHNYTSVFPIINNALTNIQYLAKAGKERNAKGLVVSNWGDMGHESPKELLYYLYAFNGACAWNTEKVNAGEVHQQYFKLFFRIPTTLASSCYAMLSNPTLGVTWKEFWRHPLLPTPKTPTWKPDLSLLNKKTALEWELPVIKQTIDTLRKQVKENRETLDSWEMVHGLLSFYAQKVDLQDRLQNYQKMSNPEQNKLTDELLKDLEAMPLRIDTLQKRFETFWAKYNKKEGFEPIKWKFKNLIAAFQDIKDIILYRQSYDVTTPAKWIYPQAKPDQPQTYVIFKRPLLLTELPITATMQVMADCHALIYINGELIDSVYTRNIFSAHLEPKLTKWIDFKNKIPENIEDKPENERKIEIMIKVRNYNEGLRNLLPNANINPSAGANVVIRLQGADLETFVYSDDTWDYYNNEQDLQPKRPVIQPYRYEVIAPNFQQNRPSWVER